MNNKSKARRISILGIFTAIILIQNFVPFFGNIPIPPFYPTIIQITVVVATFLLGTTDGVIVGTIWGVFRFIKAYVMPTTPLDPLVWTNPIISILPRVLIGLFTGLSYKLLTRINPNGKTLNLTVSSVIGSLTNTVFVLIFMLLFFGNSPLLADALNVENLGWALVIIIAAGGIPEAILTGIVAPLITKPLQKIFKRTSRVNSEGEF